MTTSSARIRGRGFSLVELLLVVAVLLLLMTAAQMALSSVSSSTKISTSAQTVADAFNLARQIAVAQNQYVQVRLFAPQETPANYSVIGVYRADMPYYLSDYSTVEGPGKMRREGPYRRLQEPMVIWGSDQHSTLTKVANEEAMRKGTGFKIDGKNYNWTAFYFRPDGGMDLAIPSSSTDNFLSLTMAAAGSIAGNKLPDNFATLTIDPINGRFRVLRP